MRSPRLARMPAPWPTSFRSSAYRRHGRRPVLEWLEDRLVPNSWSITAGADGTAADRNSDGVYEILDTSSQYVVTGDQSGTVNGVERGLAEFHIGNIPASTVVTSARLLGNVTILTYGSSGLTVKFYGYASNGTLSTDQATQTKSLVGTLNSTSLGQFAVPIDTGWLQSVLGNVGGYAGLTMTMTQFGDRIWMDSIRATPSPPSPRGGKTGERPSVRAPPRRV